MNCPYEGCDQEIDIPAKTFDGTILDCRSCDREIYVIVGADGAGGYDVELEAVTPSPYEEALTDAERNPSINDDKPRMPW